MSQLEKIRPKYLERKDINGIDIGFKYIKGKSTKTLCIRFYVNRKYDEVKEEHKIPSEIEGVPTDILIGNFNAVARNYDSNVRPDYMYYNPMIGGAMIQTPENGNNDSGIFNKGTAGLIVKRRDTNTLALLTNFHVVNFGGGVANRGVVHQPEYPTRDIHYFNPDENLVGEIGKTFLGYHNTTFVDAALIDVLGNGRTFTNEILEIGAVNGIRALSQTEADLNIHVSKYGATTGLTSGFIDGLDIEASVAYSGIGNFWTTGCLKIIPDESNNGLFASGGDSGSVVVDDDNMVVGLLFSADEKTGIAIMCPIQTVFENLNIEIPSQNDLNNAVFLG